MVVGSRVWPADDHDRVAGCGRGRRVVNAVVIDGRLEEMRVGLEPRLKGEISYSVDLVAFSRRLMSGEDSPAEG